jgi:serine/threonine-protein kinase HipA
MNTSLIEVWIWGQLVGSVAPDPRLGCHAFAYAPAWIRRRVDLAPLTMPLPATPGPVFAFPSLSPNTFKGLPGLLADALPDNFGNGLIDAWMAKRGVPRQAITALDRLAYMGRRGMGALEFKPALGAQRESREPLVMQSIVETARRVVHGDLDGDAHAQAALQNIIRVGTSAGGARAKAVVAWNPETAEVRCGQFSVPPGSEHWLLKFDGVGPDMELGTGADYGRIEYAYYLMASAAKIVMAPCHLLEENGRAHFMTRRFDRDGNTKHHVQTLCALQHLDYNQRATHAYEQLFMTAAALKLDAAAHAQLFRRMAFNVMARNCDDHTKNFAFLHRQGGAWELTPAYDVTHAYNPQGAWTHQHLMSVAGKFTEIARADLLEVAERFRIVKPIELLADVRAALASWPEFARSAGLTKPRVDQVAADFQVV